jgi:hypothetical protein
MTKKPKKFELDPADVHCGWIGHRHGLRRSLTRASSSVDVRGSIITMRHAPTGIEVRGEIEMGHYSNKKIHEAQAALRDRLLVQLTDAVARHLRVPGR